MKNYNRKRGFTLVELVISMIVTLVALTVITSLIVVVVKNCEKNQKDLLIYQESYIVRNHIYNWYNGFTDYNQAEQVTFSSNEAGDTLIASRGDEYVASLWLDREQKILHCSNKYTVVTLHYTYDVFFLVGDDVIRAMIYIEGQKNPLVMILKNGGELQ